MISYGYIYDNDRRSCSNFWNIFLNFPAEFDLKKVKA